MKNKKKKGISLIVLVITIIVIIILTGMIIISLSTNNPIFQATKATYLSDLKNFQTELELYQSKQFADKMGQYNPTLLQADDSSITYNGVLDTSKTIDDLIPSLEKNTKYDGQFQIIEGKLIYGGLDINKQNWSIETGVEVVIIGEPKITIIAPNVTLAEQGTDIVYKVKFSSNLPLTTIDLIGKVEVLYNDGVPLSTQPDITIGIVSGTSSDATRQVDITIKTDNLVNGSYKLKIKSGVVTNINNITNTTDTISLIGFDISDEIPPQNPVMTVDFAEWTNENVTVTISYSEDSAIKEYSLDAATWSAYTSPVVISTNNTTVYARGRDLATNESGLSTLTVANIDKVLPIVTAINGGVTTSSITVNAVASDTGGSNLNVASYQYSKDNGATWTVASTDTSYVFTSLLTGTYQCKVRVTDNAGNIGISESLETATLELGTITMSADSAVWTNEDVAVTINYPASVVTKQYSIDATTWSTYTSPVVVSTNNTTVYAKGLDSAGNQTTQATLTVSNIDKILPTVTASNGGATTSTITVVGVASDTGGSGLNVASYQYSKDNGATWVVASTDTDYIFTALSSGTYQCKVKVTDNAGNITISNAVAITTATLGSVTLVANVTSWTNGNVTVTINYPAEIVTKQYSTNGTTWSTYTSPVVVSTNNTTVYAKGLDAGGNQTTQATLTVSNIDKVTPVVSFTDEIIVGINTVIDSTFLKNNTTITDNVSTINQITINNIVVRNSSNTIVSNTLSGYDIYNVSYNVVDTAGNIKSVSRTIITKPISSINLTNILPNPSFEAGTGYWYNYGHEAIRVTERAYSGSYSFRVYSNNAQNWPRYNYNSYNIQGRAIYTRVYAYKTLSAIAPGLTFTPTATTEEWPAQFAEYMNYSTPVPINQWTPISISTPNAEYQYFKIMTAQTNETATGYVWFDGLMVIDLTATFGSNVPTKKWVDKMIPYFDTTSTLSW